MVPGLEKVDAFVGHQINDPMFLRQAPRPGSRREILQRFRFRNSREWIAENSFDDLQRTQCNAPIDINPVPKIIPEFGMEDG